MKTASSIVRNWQGCKATTLALTMLLPPIRHTLEQRMVLHMLLQFPLFVLIGLLLAGQLSAPCRARIARWNIYGITGLVFVAIAAAIGMVPRLLDLALIDVRVEITKCAALVLCGLALRLSWRQAGIVVQLFFLGNVLPMMAIAGSLYIETPQRLCNAYRLEEQLYVGKGLIWLAAGLGTLWLIRVGLLYSREDGPKLQASGIKNATAITSRFH